MNRRQLLFVILVNALVSLVVALGVAWLIDLRRPDLEELAAIYTPVPAPILAAPPTPTAATVALSSANEAPTVAATVAASDSEQVYEVKDGDSLLSIAGQFGVTVDDLVEANALANPDFVFSGQRLVIPIDGADGVNASPATVEPTPIAGVLISRIDGAGDLAIEQVLVVNESNVAVNLQGWRLEREDGPAYTFGNTPLFPGSSIRIHSAVGQDTSIDFFWGQSAALWQSGTVAKLIDGQDQAVNTYFVP